MALLSPATGAPATCYEPLRPADMPPCIPQMVTASGDGLLKIWNIAVRYHMDEDPKVGWLWMDG